jgi:hypothetical protein
MIGTLLSVGGWMLAGFLWTRNTQLKMDMQANEGLLTYYRDVVTKRRPHRGYWTPARVDGVGHIDLRRPGAEL